MKHVKLFENFINDPLREWQGSLINLRDDNKLPSELNEIGKDMIRKYPAYKNANCWFDEIRYDDNGSILTVSGEITPIWKTYRRKNFYFKVFYRFENGKIKTSSVQQYT
jgi:hypothetical protein